MPKIVEVNSLACIVISPGKFAKTGPIWSADCAPRLRNRDEQWSVA